MDATLLTPTQILDWTLLDDVGSDYPTVATGTIDTVDYAGKLLSITTCHADANAAGANYVTIKIYGCFGSDPAVPENWRVIGTMQAGGGTATKVDVGTSSAAGQKELLVADTTAWDTGLQERIFVLDATPANSELVTIAGWHDNTHYTCLNNLSQTHANTADLLDGVTAQTFILPNELRYYEVVWSNSDDDATYYVRADIGAVTDYE